MSQPPIRRQIVVPAPPHTAFTVFTDGIGGWWPLDGAHSVYRGGSTVEFRDGALVERGPDGTEAVWGRILAWEPPHRLRLTWHPGYAEERGTEVTVSFAAVAGGAQTLVTLEHAGWERLADGAARRAGYTAGWPVVLRYYVDSVGTEADDAEPAGPVWLALLHGTGAAYDGGTLFTHPDFGEHIAFLQRLRDRGVLVAAGPLERATENDSDGEGMTIIRLPGVGDVAEYVRLAQEDDLSVARGLLEVRVRPWRVAVSA
jgi:uncharacterized protein YndB with AHSA1/START domain/uncharacterized protein YciI